MKIAVAATVLCLTVVAVAAANQRKGCAERGGECKSVERGDQTTCPGGVRKLDCSGSDRCCLAKGDRNQAGGGKHGNKEEINDKKKKTDGQRSGNARPPSRGEGRGPKKGDRNGGRKADGQGNGNGGDRPRNGRKPNQSPEKPRDGKPKNGRRPNQSPERPRHGKSGNGRKPNQNPENSRDGKPRNGRKPNQSPERPKNGRKPNQNDQGGRGDRPRGGKRLNKNGKNPKQEVSEEGSNDKGGEGGEEAGESSDNKPPKRAGNKGGSNRQASCRVKKQCQQLKGKCQSASSTCRGTSYTGNNFCLGSCSCCVKKNQLCRPKNKCKKKNGTCQFKWDSCDGQKLKRACKGSSSACVCCAPRSCKDKNNQCSAAGGSCVLKGGTCAGQVDSSLCGKFCQCCLEPTTSTTEPTTSSTEQTTSTTEPTTTPKCNITRGYCPKCGIAPISVDGIRIVNGTAASENEYPYQVYVYADTGNCGGSIIKKKWVMTAAHCLRKNDGSNASLSTLTIGYGSRRRPKQMSVNAVRYIVHEDYDPYLQGEDILRWESDIALIELQTELNFETSEAVKPICLGEESDIIGGMRAVVSGWGYTEYGANNTMSILREVALDVLSSSDCQRLSQRPDVSKVVCTQTMFKSFCQGDSGGPLVVKTCLGTWVQIGIVSYGRGCAYGTDPGVYTRVPTFRPWIDNQTGSSTAC